MYLVVFQFSYTIIKNDFGIFINIFRSHNIRGQVSQ